MTAAPLRNRFEERGGPGGRLSFFLRAILLPVFFGTACPVRAQMELVVELPGEPGEMPAEFREHVFEIEIDPDRFRRSAAPPLDVDLGQLSPLNPGGYATGNILVQVRSPWGYFPPYRIEARARTAISQGLGDFTTRDVGMGVSNVVAANPVVNPRFDYDPSLAAKDVDGEPLFQGTVATLPLTPPRLWLYRTQGWFMGDWNSFLLTFAVGPQFFSPTGAERVRVEIAVRR